MIKSIKHTFFDVLMLYKNFLNWNIKKSIIFIWSYFFAFVVSLPLFILFFLIAYFLWEDLKEVIFNLIMKKSLWSYLLSILFYITLSIFYLFLFYRYLLLAKFYLSYLNKEERKIKNNYYLDFKKIKRYLVLSFIIFWVIFLLFIIYVLIFVILFFLFGKFEGIEKLLVTWDANWFSIITLIITIIWIFSLIYLVYKLIFSYFFLIEDKENNLKILDCIKKSIKKTKWVKKFIKFIILTILFVSILIPSTILVNLYKKNINDISIYATYEYWITEEEQKEIISSGFINSIDINTLQLKYSEYSIEQLENIVKKYQINIIVVKLINFILFFWLYTMILTSFYKREILDK